MNPIAFITGATGCIGSYLTRDLYQKGWDVNILVLPEDNLPFQDLPGINIIRGDINTFIPEMLPEQAVIFHLAAKVHMRPKTDKDIKDFFHVNTEGTAHLASCALKRNCKGFVFISSLAVYGHQVEYPNCNENISPVPESVYGKSKLAAEIKLRELLTNRIPYVILRPCVIYGQGDKGNFASLISWIVDKKRPLILINHAANRKNTLHAKDMSSILTYFGENITDNDKEVINIASPEILTMREIMLTIAESANIRPLILSVPKLVLKPVSLLGDIISQITKKEFFFSSRKLHVLTSDTLIETSKLSRIISHNISFIDFKDGIKALINTDF